ncbi:MAG: hypothetical protein ACETVZ_05125 [Phycisphaerae bacterium]
MKNLSIVALSVVVMLSGCAGYTSRTFQIKQPQVDDSAAKTATKEQINIQKAAEIAREVLESYNYTITYFKCKSNRYACVRAKKYDEIGWVLPHLFRYRTEIRIRGKDLSHQYELSSYRKYVPWLDLNPFDYFRPYHRAEKEEQKILDKIEQKYQ